MSDRERHRLESAIAAQESLRGVIDDDVIEAAIAAIRQQVGVTERKQRRRLVTVLFADLRGFTAISDRLDPEILTDLMNDLWRRVDAIVTDHGGHVDKHMGDAVMAVWGIDGTAEHDAERAVRAGLDLQDAVRDTTAATDTGAELSVRVGINTGRALIGTVGSTNELTVMGDTVNVASRLEHAAPVGGVLIAHDTYNHVRGVFDVSPRDPLAVRGKTDPIQTYLVLRAKPRAFRIGTRGVEGVETRTVGRGRELAHLQTIFERVTAGNGLQATLVIGEAGIGKSRLLYDLRGWLELLDEPIRLLEGRALPGRQGVALGLIRDVIARRFEIRDSDSPIEVERKLRDGFGSSFASAEVDTVSSWLGLGMTARETTGSEHLAALGRATMIKWLRLVVGETATVVLLEDLHWADLESLDLVWALADELSEARLMIVGLSRPDIVFDEQWFDQHPSADRVELNALDREASAALVREVLKRVDHLPDELVDLIVDRSDGNPFFVEEIVKMLRDHGVIVDAGDDGWTIATGELDPADVPSTIAGVLQARLDQLSPDTLTALQHAAIIGRTFWDDAVDSISDHPAPPNTFAEAVQRELVYRLDDSGFAGCDEFVFKHALLRDVTYETVLLRNRGALHAKVARWLTARAGERVDEYLETIADHHHRAGEFDKAAACLTRAGVAAMDRGLMPVALERFDASVEEWGLAGEPPPLKVLVLVGEANRRRGDADAAERALRTVLDRSATGDPDDVDHRAEALYLLSEVAYDRGVEADELAFLEDAEHLVGGEPSLVLCRIAVGLAWWETRHGDLAKGYVHGLRALALADELDSDRMRWRAHGVLGAISGMRDDFADSERHMVMTVEIARRVGDVAGEAVSIGNLGVLQHVMGDATGSVERYRSALDHYERDLEFRIAIADPFGAIDSTFNRAQVLVRLGRLDEAGAAIRDGLIASLRSNYARHLLTGVGVEADRLVTLGEIDAGLDLLVIVRDHPAAQRGDVQEIERILQLASLPADALDGRPVSDSSDDLEAMVQAILDC